MVSAVHRGQMTALHGLLVLLGFWFSFRVSANLRPYVAIQNRTLFLTLKMQLVHHFNAFLSSATLIVFLNLGELCAISNCYADSELPNPVRTVGVDTAKIGPF